MHLSVEGLRPWECLSDIAVSPGETHSDSRVVLVTGTVVKPQQPTNRPISESRSQSASQSDEVQFRREVCATILLLVIGDVVVVYVFV